jgi:NAD(P)-dependent dehydrogenase (short-subunit alcohol dehydrogenase family)
MAHRVAAGGRVEIADRVSAGHDRLAVAGRAAGAKNLVVGIVQANCTKELGHGHYDTHIAFAEGLPRDRMPATKVAIVTGGNRGLGREIARQLLKAEMLVVIGSRNEKGCAAAVEELAREGGKVAGYPLDVIDTHSVQRFVQQVERQHGAPSVLVNNAGVYPESRAAKVEDTPTSLWRETLETNLFGAVRMCREVVPHMRRLRYGRIVNVSSGLGQLHQMGAGSPAYRVSKAALNALTATLAAEVADAGILVNSMSPGWVRTDMGGQEAPRSVEEGADTAVWLSLLPSNGPTGQFFRDRKPIPW